MTMALASNALNQPAGRFDGRWLTLREPTDHQARDASLTQEARRWLEQCRSDDRPLHLIDLGSGSGSNVAYLANHWPGPQHWRLIDQDAELLEQAERRLQTLRDDDARPLAWQHEQRSLTPFDPTLLDGADLVSASALFDLVSRDWLDGFVQAMVERRLPGLFTLSITGGWRFIDADGNYREDADDRWVRRTLDEHQHRDKGFGAALGGNATDALAERFAAHGYDLMRAASPWVLTPSDADARPLALALLDGWAEAALEQRPDEATRIHAWHARRRTSLEAGDWGVRVEHDDLFVHPRHGG
ncbi:MAG: hypothetical protein AWU55_2438 [Halomonadaceae bacterium T82-2]|nr:MAG: hypothetical protein AWU55_2438 [Halomonadaceae bacterium T82-2]